MQYGFLYIVGVLLIVVAVGLVYVVLRRNPSFRPTDGFQWSAVGMAALVIVFAGFMMVLVASVDEQQLRGTSYLEEADVRAGEMGRSVDDFEFRLVSTDEGARFSMLRGKVVLVNIWATWCAPCRIELPELNRLQADFRDDGLVVLNLSDEPRDDLLTYESALPLNTMSAYVDPATIPDPLRRNFQVRPASFVIDRDGVLRASALGIRSYDQFLDMVRPYLEARASREV